MPRLSERDVCTRFITPALVSAGWDLSTQIREEVSFTKGRVIVRGKLHSRGKGIVHDAELQLKIAATRDKLRNVLHEALAGED